MNLAALAALRSSAPPVPARKRVDLNAGRFARWHIPVQSERESEGWLLSYLDILTLLLGLLVAMLALSKAAPAGPQAATHEASAAAHAGPSGIPVHLVGKLGTARLAPSAEWLLPLAAVQQAQADPLLAAASGAGAVPVPDVAAQLVAPAEFVGPPVPPALIAAIAAAGSAPAGSMSADSMPGAPALLASASDASASGVPVPEPAPLPTAQELGLNELGDAIDVIVNEKSVSFRISSELLFPSGQSSLTEAGLRVLDKLAAVLKRNNYRVAVEGHTDPVPIQTDRFASNWELSTGRATSVLRYLERSGLSAARLRATGYADTRPLESNDSATGRAANRRVELIMETRPGG